MDDSLLLSSSWHRLIHSAARWLLLGTLTACEGNIGGFSLTTQSYHVGGSKAEGVEKIGQDSVQAAFSPLQDLGLRKKEIPALLTTVAENPYLLSEPISCLSMQKEVADLNDLLGEDLDRPKQALTLQDKAVEEGTGMVHDAVVGFVSAQVNIIPLRSIVRRMTGANKSDKALAQAVEAGKLRRAYLRGVADARFGTECISGKRVIVGEAVVR